MIWPFKSKVAEPEPEQNSAGRSIFSTDDMPMVDLRRNAQAAIAKAIPAPPKMADDGAVGMDSSFTGMNASAARQGIPDAQALWYASQGFIGYQMCAIIAQNWLVDKACRMPGRDAIRQGYDITVNSGEGMDPEILDAMRQADKRHNINKSMRELVHFGRIFGVRIGLFMVNSTDPEYYAKPFNLDGVTPGSYRGISQIDPTWVSPILTSANLSDPASLTFYEPTFYQVGGRRIHRSHLAIYVPHPVTDILKPAYQYGGIPLTQLIYERVYAAERTANEGPQLAMTKRSTVFKTNMDAAFADWDRFQQTMEWWTTTRDNYGVKIADTDDEMQQFDTALGDLDATIMTQYQLVAAIANVPATKLLGTTPKGFNSTGEYEEANYREELESVQADMTPMLERHHALVMKSEIAPRFKIEPIETSVSWAALDSPTAAEWATINKTKAETASALVQIGAIDGMDVRELITNDPDSDYHGLAIIEDEAEVEEPDTTMEPDNGEAQNAATPDASS